MPWAQQVIGVFGVSANGAAKDEQTGEHNERAHEVSPIDAIQCSAGAGLANARKKVSPMG